MRIFAHVALCILLVPAASIIADDTSESIQLGCKSKTDVAIASLQGALGGLATYVGLHMLGHGLHLPNVIKEPATPLLLSSAGAAVAGIWKYYHTPEKYFEFAHDALVQVPHNELFTLLITTQSDTLIQNLKDFYFREKLPLYAAFRELEKICDMIDQSKKSLKEVLSSYRADLYQESNDLLMIADMYLVILKDIFKLLKDDPNFIAECNAGTLQLIKEAQQASAAAAESSAFWQQMAFLTQPSTVVVYQQGNA